MVTGGAPARGRARSMGAFCAVAGALAAASCKPNLNDTVSLIGAPTLVAVQSTPAEAPPMTRVTYTALVVGPDGELSSAPLQWDYCGERNPLSNLGPVAVQCAVPGNPALALIGTGLRASGALPTLGCTTFGPNPPPATAGMPAGRPVDPDTTGGYYQPVSVFLPQSGEPQALVYDMRLSCGFSGANEDAQGALSARYHANENPSVASLSSSGAAWLPEASGKTNAVPAGQHVSLAVAWPACPRVDKCDDGICGADESLKSCPADCKTPKGCAGAERYVNFDLASQGVLDAREGMQVSWYATGGVFDNDSTGRTGDDTATTSDNGWQAPSQAGTVHLWVVLHDDRGGIGWSGYVLQVH
jgi:hypothetical protein